MNAAPQIHGKTTRYISQAVVLETLGDALLKIKSEDRLTWADVGTVLGKSEDQAMKYADGSSEMGIFAYRRALAAWGDRIARPLDRLFGIEQSPRNLDQGPLV